MPKIHSSVLLAGAVLLHIASADPIHAIQRGAFQHHDSGWIFPQHAAGFERVGAPQDVDGSRDAIAYYARSEKGARSTAVVDVYPRDSAAGAMSLAQAQAALERDGALAAAKKVRSRLQLPTPVLAIDKVAYRASKATTHLYFVAHGEWIVRIRVSSATLAAQLADDFARSQRWETLGNPRGGD
jgi:hypothetical protein